MGKLINTIVNVLFWIFVIGFILGVVVATSGKKSIDQQIQEKELRLEELRR